MLVIHALSHPSVQYEKLLFQHTDKSTNPTHLSPSLALCPISTLFTSAFRNLLYPYPTSQDPPSPPSPSSSSPGTHFLTSPSHSWTIRFPPFYSQQFQSPEGFISQVTSHNFRIFFSSLSLREKTVTSQSSCSSSTSFFFRFGKANC